MNIYESITAILGEKAAVKKDRVNEVQRYKFRGIDEVMNVFNPLLAKHKVFVVPTVLDMAREERQNSKGNTLLYTILTVQYTFYAEDGTFVTAVAVGEGMDTGDKSVNKAMSAAYKYALFQTFCVPTEDMVDSEEESPEVAPKKAPAQKKQAPKQEAAPLPPVDEVPLFGNDPIDDIDDEVPKCEECGAELQPYVGKNGKQVSVGDHVVASRKAFAKTLCLDCIAKRRGR